MPRTWDPHAIDPATALQQLVEGNRRFVRGERRHPLVSPAELATDQSPFAVVLGCSDSRVPSEIVFDQGVGDLFVIRVIGHVVTSAEIGSVEFAVSQFGVRLVLVVGHTRCGAVTATLRSLVEGETPESRHIASVTEKIAPYVAPLVKLPDANARLAQAVVANVRGSIEQLRHGSALLDELTQSGRVEVRGAVYQLESGVVELLDP